MASRRTRKTASTTIVTRAAVYLRVSTDAQAERYGLDVQRERCLALATSRGWDVIGEYCDAGVSGTKAGVDRPELARLLADAAAGRLDVVIVLSVDRLGRTVRLVLDLVKHLQDCGIALASVKEPELDTSTPTGTMLFQIRAVIAEFERSMIVERTTAGRNARAAQDGERGGRLPFGYRRLPGGAVEVDDDAAAAVRMIYQLRTDGLALRKIAEHLDRAGVATGRGHKWHASSVREVLRNEAAYRGSLRGMSSTHKWPPILGRKRCAPAR